MIFSTALLASCLASLASASPICKKDSLPIVDVGTSVHRAVVNSNDTFYSFKNIPYAESPTGLLRFANPVPRVTVNRTVNDGSNSLTCVQGSPGWFSTSIPYVLQTIVAGGADLSNAELSSATYPASEDCLLLDVHVPVTGFNGRNLSPSAAGGLPVIVWIHGGAYVSGSKNAFDVSGLMQRGIARDSGVIVVTINYRLGLFGFPPRQPGMFNISSNAGLYDQRLALTWVKENAWRFGGDGSDVTVMGESAGAGSIVYQMTAFGGANGVAPFKRAIVQSPAMKPATGASLYSELYTQFLNASGLTSIWNAYEMTTAELTAINVKMVGDAAFGTAAFAPNIDGYLVPEEPGTMLLEGKIDGSVELMVAHNSNEGLQFTNPDITTQAGFVSFIEGILPTVSSSVISHLTTVTYPEDYSGAQPYTTATGRVDLAVGDLVVACYAYGLNKAVGGTARGYQFARFPGMHSQDTAFTWWTGNAYDGWGLPVPAETAITMQGWFVDFATSGYTGSSSALDLPVYGSTGQVRNISGDLGATTYADVTDPAFNSRCAYIMGITAN